MVKVLALKTVDISPHGYDNLRLIEGREFDLPDAIISVHVKRGNIEVLEGINPPRETATFSPNEFKDLAVTPDFAGMDEEKLKKYARKMFNVEFAAGVDRDRMVKYLESEYKKKQGDPESEAIPEAENKGDEGAN